MTGEEALNMEVMYYSGELVSQNLEYNKVIKLREVKHFGIFTLRTVSFYHLVI